MYKIDVTPATHVSDPLKEYCKIPSRLLRELTGFKKIPRTAKDIYKILYDLSKFDANREVKISINKLCDLIASARSTIEGHIRTLEKMGFIKRIKNYSRIGSQLINTYKIFLPECLLNSMINSNKVVSIKPDNPVNKVEQQIKYNLDEIGVSATPPAENCGPFNKNDVVYKEDINNNTEHGLVINSNQSDVVLNKELNRWQVAYVQGMFKNVLKQSLITKELFDQVCFSLTSEFQFIGATFKKKVNAIAKLLKTGRWRTPIGFNNHCAAGKARREFYKGVENWKKQENQQLSNHEVKLCEYIQIEHNKRKSFDEREKSETINHFKQLIKDAESRLITAEKEGEFSLVQSLNEYIKSIYYRIQGAQYA